MNNKKIGKVIKNIREFILGGKAEFSIKNEVNGFEVQYKLINKQGYKIWFVYIISDNKSTYAGNIRIVGNGVKYLVGEKGNYKEDTKEIKGLLWVLNKGDNIGEKVSIYHHFKCSVCGRELTDQESIERGMGNTCARKFGLIFK